MKTLHYSIIAVLIFIILVTVTIEFPIYPSRPHVEFVNTLHGLPDYNIGLVFNGTQTSRDVPFYLKQGQNFTLIANITSVPTNLPVSLDIDSHVGFTKTNGVDSKLSVTKIKTPEQVIIYVSATKDATPNTYQILVKANDTLMEMNSNFYVKVIPSNAITNLSFDHHLACDMECKTYNERMGRTCIEQSDDNFLCKSASRFVTSVAIPWGSKNMSYQRNFIAPNMTVSLEINNTVGWVNADDFPHRITSDSGLFDSGVIQPFQTWAYVFDKVGTYRYHGEYPWLKGQINVVGFDPNYKGGNSPIFKYTNTPTVFYYIFKETDSFWYVQSLKVLDDNSVFITLSDYKNNTWIGEPITKTFKIGDSFIGNCGDNATPVPEVEFLTLERIVTTPVQFAEFKDETGHISDTKCSFIKLEK